MDLNADASSYCREIEAYLCRKNDGHLIRIVGPAFEQVRGWAGRGIPLKVACRGIDRYVERYYAKGPRRRPVRIEFCEADVLDVFDEWRRALGLAGAASFAETSDSATAGGDAGEMPEVTRRHGSLPAHLERVHARLEGLGEEGRAAIGPEQLTSLRAEIESLRTESRGVRGEARQRVIARLADLDQLLLHLLRERLPSVRRAAIEAEAAAELAPFRARLAPDAWERSRAAAVDRLLREQLRVPIIAYDR
jgi:hypothetical protein